MGVKFIYDWRKRLLWVLTESGGRLVVGHLLKSFRSFICLYVFVGEWVFYGDQRKTCGDRFFPSLWSSWMERACSGFVRSTFSYWTSNLLCSQEWSWTSDRLVSASWVQYYRLAPSWPYLWCWNSKRPSLWQRSDLTKPSITRQLQFSRSPAEGVFYSCL